MGIAAHMGLWIDLPSIGCAKSLLCGTHDPVGEKAGSSSWLLHRGEIVGADLRTKDRVNPVYVSPGHRIDLNGAIEITLRVSGKYRVPEPTRLAHLWVNEVRRGYFKAASSA